MDTYNMIDFNEKKGFICDMDGVIYHGNRVLPDVAEFIQWLHDENKEYLFLTNNSGYTPRELSQKLARMGLDLVGLKKRLMDVDTRLRRSLNRSHGTVDPAVHDDLTRLKQLEDEIDVTLRETIAAVKIIKRSEEGLDT